MVGYDTDVVCLAESHCKCGDARDYDLPQRWIGLVAPASTHSWGGCVLMAQSHLNPRPGAAEVAAQEVVSSVSPARGGGVLLATAYVRRADVSTAVWRACKMLWAP